MKQAIYLKRNQKRMPGHVMPKKKEAWKNHDSKYAVMDAWGMAMSEMKKHGTMPDMTGGEACL